MRTTHDAEKLVRDKWRLLKATMDERQRRLWAGAEADAMGFGGVAAVARATKLAISTVRKGRDEARAVAGTVAGADSAIQVHVAGRGRFKPPGAYSVTEVPAGEWDAFALRGAAQALPFVPDRIIRKDAVTVSANLTTTLDFDFASEGFAPESHAVSIEGVMPTEEARIQTTLRTKPNGTSVTFGSSIAGQFPSVPLSQRRRDDIHFIDVAASARGSNFVSRQVRRWAVAPSNFTASLPPMPPPPLVSSDETEPYLLMRGALPAGVDADRYDFRYSQARASSYTTWTTTLSRGYVEATTNEYALPDLSALAGFSAAWGLRIAEPVEWAFVTTASEARVGNLFTIGQPAEELDGLVEATTHQTGRFPR